MGLRVSTSLGITAVHASLDSQEGTVAKVNVISIFRCSKLNVGIDEALKKYFFATLTCAPLCLSSLAFVTN